MSNIIPISKWRRIFFDTSFIIECVLDAEKHKDYKRESILCAQKILNYIQTRDRVKEYNTRWVTSSIVISELSKLDYQDAMNGLMNIFQTPEVEIINFTTKEAYIILEKFNDFVEEKHFNSYLSLLAKTASEQDIFNPRCILSNDAKIAACAKSKCHDVILTSDKHTFAKLAHKIQLPVLLSTDIPLDMHGDVDDEADIKVSY